ncbi:hypothetical protein ACB092_02G114100, partial [Castanea dentata]
PLLDLNDINADEDVEPPSLRRLPSRPRKNRRREPGKQPTGLNVARRSNTIKCQTCKRFGYNKHIGQRYSTGILKRSLRLPLSRKYSTHVHNNL